MTPLALDLDPSGIRLLRRQDGACDCLGDVPLDAPDLGARLAALRETAARAAEGRLETVLLIPASQILYTSIAVTGATPGDAEIRRELARRTPCPPEELVFDWRREGDRIRIAAVDVTTLDEAEGFAVPYGFAPVRFSATPSPEEFPEPPDFGPTQFVRHRALEDGAIFASRRGSAAARPGPRPAPRREGPRAGRAAPAARRRQTVVTLATAALTAAALVWTAGRLLAPEPFEDVAALAGLIASPDAEAAAGTEPEPRALAVAPTAQPGAAPLSVRPAGGALPDPAHSPVDLALLDPRPLRPGPGAADSLPTLSLAVPQGSPEAGAAATALPAPAAPHPLRPHDRPSDDGGYLAALDPDVTVGDAVALSLLQPEPPLPAAMRRLPGARAEPPLPAPAAAAPAPQLAALADKSPRLRPGALVETHERALLGGHSRAELAGKRVRTRPVSAQERQTVAAPAAASPLALAATRLPAARPEGMGAIVAATRAAPPSAPAPAETAPAQAPAVAVAVAPAAPILPSVASVSRRATIENALPLSKVNLIGVYGSAGNRRALVRLPNGRFVKVQVGDRVDGGRVAAIGDSELRYVKGGRNLRLTVPSG